MPHTFNSPNYNNYNNHTDFANKHCKKMLNCKFRNHQDNFSIMKHLN